MAIGGSENEGGLGVGRRVRFVFHLGALAMPEADVESELLFQVPLRLDEKEQIAFPIPGDLSIALIRVQFLFQAREPFRAWENSCHMDSSPEEEWGYCTIRGKWAAVDSGQCMVDSKR